MEISNHVLKLTGKAELPQPIEMGNNWNIALSGSIKSATDSDNEDGTLTRIYTFKPIKIELLNPLGETIKLKDTRSASQQLRSLLWKRWVNAAAQVDFDEAYEKFIHAVMRDLDEIVDRNKIF